MPLFRTITFVVLLILPFSAARAELRQIQASPRISAVTVYPDRALTVRRATVSLMPGSYRISLGPMPVLLYDDSVRVEGRGSARAAIAGLEVHRNFLPGLPEKRAEDLQEQIRTLQRRVGSLDAELASLSAQRGFIESIRVAWGDRISKELAVGKPTAAELKEALSFIGSGMTGVEEKKSDLGGEKARLSDRIDALRRELETLLSSGARESKTVTVDLDVAQAGELTLEISGVVPNAGWVPSYDARLADDARLTELVFRGQVRQQTGEDWSGVELSLSTARPAMGGRPPEMPPWRISFFRPLPMERKMSYGGGRSARADEPETALTMAAPPPAPAGHLTADIAAEHASVLFRIPRPVDIRSDGSEQGVVVAVEKLPVTVEYLAIPKVSPYAYLRSEQVNSTAYPLLPGKVNIFTGGNYTGSSRLERVPSGERFALFFGVDDQVTVKREELKSHKEAGLFGRNRQTYLYRIEVANFRKEPQTVVIKDQLPVAEDEEIKVSLQDPSRKPDEQTPDGTLSWKLRVEPGRKETVTFGIVVEYPKDREVAGL